ncbi:hypothetical protein OGAPHI_005817 [Ogataea philodendri]|uniref:Uncharacterized protein n=1 Tax=Ogataea philodendri TaxID=1378263 RepID=A0A9P8NZI0_9ASCO|nr:uncharacterized protein OGAPHI_005817 [Ogataea philodendri]KAH3662565.1 hypothetical protein OGAPHI_005817 [Ogataea philodendri]
MEHNLAVCSVLGNGALRTPVHQHIARLQDLRRTLRFGKQAVWGLVVLEQLGLPRLGVHLNNFSAGNLVDLHQMAVFVLCSVGRVVKERDDLFLAVLGSPQVPCVVLEAESKATNVFKARAGLARNASQLPDNLACLSVDLVHRGGVSGREQVVSVLVLVDRVDMEVIPRIARVITRTGITRVNWEHRLVRRNVVQRGPFKQHLAGLKVKFLENGVHNPLLLLRSTKFAKVPGNRLVNLKQAGFLVLDVELVLVRKLVLAGTQLLDELVAVVQERVVAVAMAIGRVVVSFKRKQNVLAVELGGLEIGVPDRKDAVPRPHKVSLGGKDVRSSLSWSVQGVVREARERSHEKIVCRGLVVVEDGDVQLGRSQVGPTAVLPVGVHGQKE